MENLPIDLMWKLDKYATNKGIEKPMKVDDTMTNPVVPWAMPWEQEVEMETETENPEMEMQEKISELKAMPWFDPIAVIKLLIS